MFVCHVRQFHFIPQKRPSSEHGTNDYTEAVLPQPHPEIDWSAFLARPRLPSLSADNLGHISESSILITGAGGSIGSALAQRLAAHKPQRLVLLDSSEQALYRLDAALKSRNIYPILGNIADTALIAELLEEHHPYILLHAAAHKHVALLEDHPLAAIANNAIATHTLAKLARQHNVPQFILLSTDKAAAPTSILGASKRIAELTTMAHGGTVLRLCNVLGTEGSVVETFLRQIANHEPLSMSDPAATRYFLTIGEAVNLLIGLLIETSVTARQGTLFIPRIDNPHSITELANFLASGPAQYRETGLRPGEKLHEILWSPEETPTQSPIPGCLQLQSPTPSITQLMHSLQTLQAATEARNLPQALTAIHALVPGYTPSGRVLHLAHNSSHGAFQA